MISPQNEIIVHGFPADVFVGQHNATAISNETGLRLRFFERVFSGWGFYTLRRFTEGTTQETPVTPRRYTLTHSDTTGDLFLTVGSEYDIKQISGLYTRLMRDEVLAEWREDKDGPALHVTCHVSGGLVLGTAALRDFIFRKELALVLEALRYGDRKFFEAHPEMDRAPILVHFRSSRRRYRHLQRWGTLAEYRKPVRWQSPCDSEGRNDG